MSGQSEPTVLYTDGIRVQSLAGLTNLTPQTWTANQMNGTLFTIPALTAVAIAIALPTAVGNAGVKCRLVCQAVVLATITFTPPNPITFQGHILEAATAIVKNGATLVLTPGPGIVAGDYCDLMSDGQNWLILASSRIAAVWV